MGSRFQAEIPPLRNPLFILYDEHPAQLVWAPWGDLPTNPKTQQKGLFPLHLDLQERIMHNDCILKDVFKDLKC